MTSPSHSRSSRHSSPRAPFCTVLGADWGWRRECSSRVRARCRAEAGMRRLCGPIPRSWRQTVAIFARGSFSHFCAWLSQSLSRVLPSSKSEHQATNSSLPLIPHLQALRTEEDSSTKRAAASRAVCHMSAKWWLQQCCSFYLLPNSSHTNSMPPMAPSGSPSATPLYTGKTMAHERDHQDRIELPRVSTLAACCSHCVACVAACASAVDGVACSATRATAVTAVFCPRRLLLSLHGLCSCMQLR